MDFSSADHAFLIDAVSGETTCRIQGLEARASSSAADGGTDGGSFLSACQAAYDSCHKVLDNTPGLICIVPIAGCSATVELMSACLNEIANSDPIATCVTVPTCAMAAATGSTVLSGTGSNCGMGAPANAPSLPACDRLRQQCPNVGIFDPY